MNLDTKFDRNDLIEIPRYEITQPKCQLCVIILKTVRFNCKWKHVLREKVLFLYRFCWKQFSPAAFSLRFSDACESCVLHCRF
jgi:hypothetical protein